MPPQSRPSIHAGSISRRRFLANVSAAAGAVAVPGIALAATSAGASTAGATAGSETSGAETWWRLDSNWGYAAGPKGRTRCAGRACHNAAPNRYFPSRADALAGRLHRCCVAQPVAVTVDACQAAALRSACTVKNASNVVDLRWIGAKLPGGCAVPAPTATTPAAPPAPVGTAPTAPAAQPGAQRGPAPAAATRSRLDVEGLSVTGRRTNAAGEVLPDELVVTGTSADHLLGVGSIVGLVGAGMVALSRRRCELARVPVNERR